MERGGEAKTADEAGGGNARELGGVCFSRVGVGGWAGGGNFRTVGILGKGEIGGVGIMGQ